MIELCRRKLSLAALDDVFSICYEKMLRFGGEWHRQRRPLFPGYVILECRDEALLRQELETCRFPVAFLDDGSEKVIDVREKGRTGLLGRVSDAEEKFLKDFSTQEHLIRMSCGYLSDGVLFITEGPLKGRESLVRKLDRHKRTALIEVKLEDQLRLVTVGVEIYGKTDNANSEKAAASHRTRKRNASIKTAEEPVLQAGNF